MGTPFPLLTHLEGGPRAELSALLLRWAALLLAVRALPDELVASALVVHLVVSGALRVIHPLVGRQRPAGSLPPAWVRVAWLLLVALIALLTPGSATTTLWLVGFGVAAVFEHLASMLEGEASSQTTRAANVELATVLFAGALAGQWWLWPIVRALSAALRLAAAQRARSPERADDASWWLSGDVTAGWLAIVRSLDVVLLTLFGLSTAAVVVALARSLVELVAAALEHEVGPPHHRAPSPGRTLWRAAAGGAAALVVLIVLEQLAPRWLGPHAALFLEVVGVLSLALAMHLAAAPAWRYLLARDKPRMLAGLRVAAAATALVTLAVALAAGASVLAAAALAQLLAWLALAIGARVLVGLNERAQTVPLAYLLSLLPGGRERVDARTATAVEREVRALADDPGVRSVEVVGSARVPEQMTAGISDVDLLVTVGTHVPLPHRPPITPLHDDPLVAVHRTVLSASALRALRRTGHSLFLPRSASVAHGLRAPTRLVVEHARASNLEHALTLVLRLQGLIVHHAREDGAVRGEHVAKRFRLVFDKLGRPHEAVLRRWRGRGLGVPSGLFTTPPLRDWLDADDVACMMTIALAEVDEGFRALNEGWAVVAAAPSPPSWTEQLADAVRPRLSPILDATRPRLHVELTPTGPSNTNPMLLASWEPNQPPSRDDVALVLATERRAPPLPPVFRAYPHVCLVPPAALAADLHVEHAPLFAASRRAHRLSFHGSRPVFVSPPEALQRAAVRSTAHACFGLSRHLPQLLQGRVPLALNELVHARLPALSLWLDEGDAPTRPADVEARYQATYDDPLASLLSLASPSPAKLADALEAWKQGRLERVHARLDDEERARSPDERAS